MTTGAAPSFTADWSKTRNYWPGMFADLGLPGKPGLRFLEIGCFEGMATVWLLENVLTGRGSRIDVIDTFTGSDEFDALGVDGDSYERFIRNVEPFSERVAVRVGESAAILRTFDAVRTFDFIYVDGSHRAADVLTDAVLSWPLLKPGCLMVFDDYRWAPPGEHTFADLPAVGIEAFRAAFGDQLKVLHDTYQFVVEKL